MVTLRKAEELDSWYFFSLRTDPVAARMSHGMVPTKEEHARYWDSKCDHRWVIYGHSEKRVGTIRVSQEGYVSIVIEEDERGKGYGTKALEEILSHAKALGFLRLFAQTAIENTPSQDAFLSAGWRPILFVGVPA